ncbi:N2227-domain-containing protein [Serendipita vermifera]|nr:N2227-domain-containing protein [Serendipita vermifera]
MMSEEDRHDEVVHFLKVVQAFRQYQPYAISANTRRRRDFHKLPPRDKELLEEVGWKARLDAVDDLIAENAKLLNQVVANPTMFMSAEELEIAGNELNSHAQTHGQDHSHDHGHGHSHTRSGHQQHSHSSGATRRYRASPGDMDKVISTLKQFVRDWSKDGKSERDACYTPMIEALMKKYPDEATRKDVRVVVPGAGLARLGWEVAFLGFETQCNEFSHYMLLPSYYVLNEIQTLDQHTIYPFIHSFSNVVDSQSVSRGISFPDVLPSSLPRGSNFSMVAGDFEEIYGPKPDPEDDETGQWDAVLSCFFIDTAKNIVNYLRVIHRILAPGGVWINCGPLLWHFENSEELSIEISLEEVKSLATKIGFVIQDERTINTSYVGDEKSMLGYVYKTAFWTATKA